ncbi:MAG: tetratricopeptide repeat protein [Candidatus Obscuribacterales bacterium]|nr:tetratricopeptide repeat protein [Candidatus Obscuribacterales bacterium]
MILGCLRNLPAAALSLLLCLTGLLSASPANQALALNPQFKRHYEIGEDYLQREDFKQAITEFDEAIKIDGGRSKECAKAFRGRGTAYSDLKQYNLALKDLDKAIALDATNDLAFNNRGAVYLRTLKPMEAIKDFNQALILNPGNKYAAVNRAGAYLLTNTPKAGARATAEWLLKGGWRSDFAGHAAVLTVLAERAAKDKDAEAKLLQESRSKLDRLKWPYSLIKHWQGKASEEEVLEEAQDSTYNLTQAQCFLGLASFYSGDKDDCLRRMEFVQKHGTVNSVEYWLAKGFIQKVKSKQ